eukprot:8497271-Pyramimonas_sp.AAC.1
MYYPLAGWAPSPCRLARISACTGVARPCPCLPRPAPSWKPIFASIRDLEVERDTMHATIDQSDSEACRRGSGGGQEGVSALLKAHLREHTRPR